MQNQCEAYIQNLKMINKTIVENQQIIKMFPKIQTLSKFITQYKINQFLNFTQIINSHQYLDLLNSFKALTIQFDFKIHSKNTFPTHKIYSNAFFQRHKMYSFHLIIIPKGLQFSLHDHSDIFVITKLLYGQLIVQDMDIDQQYLKVVKFLRGKLQERRKNKFFVKKLPKSSNFLIQKKESTYSNPDNEIYTQQFYENCLKSKTSKILIILIAIKLKIGKQIYQKARELSHQLQLIKIFIDMWLRQIAQYQMFSFVIIVMNLNFDFMNTIKILTKIILLFLNRDLTETNQIFLTQMIFYDRKCINIGLIQIVQILLII